jgi:hypothetical protein
MAVPNLVAGGRRLAGCGARRGHKEETERAESGRTLSLPYNRVVENAECFPVGSGRLFKAWFRRVAVRVEGVYSLAGWHQIFDRIEEGQRSTGRRTRVAKLQWTPHHFFSFRLGANNELGTMNCRHQNHTVPHNRPQGSETRLCPSGHLMKRSVSASKHTYHRLSYGK